MKRKAPRTAFKPGQPRPANAGRKKGTPNKKTLEFQLLLQKHNFDPGEEFIYLYKEQMKIFEMRKQNRNFSGALIALSDAGQSLNNICQYVYPKKKAVEHTGEVGVKTFADFIAAGASSGDLDD